MICAQGRNDLWMFYLSSPRSFEVQHNFEVVGRVVVRSLGFEVREICNQVVYRIAVEPLVPSDLSQAHQMLLLMQLLCRQHVDAFNQTVDQVDSMGTVAHA